MRLPKLEILDEKNNILHKKSEEVTFPLSDETKKKIQDMQDYLIISQDEKLCDKYNLRAGMGLAFVQTGELKRIFVIVHEEEENKFKNYVLINPQIKSVSEEMIYVSEGEGCLSVNREVEGIVPRHARITLETYDLEGNKKTIRAREELAVAFQHELDHLNGILFVDKIDPKDPYKNKDKMREI